LTLTRSDRMAGLFVRSESFTFREENERLVADLSAGIGRRLMHDFKVDTVLVVIAACHWDDVESGGAVLGNEVRVRLDRDYPPAGFAEMPAHG